MFGTIAPESYMQVPLNVLLGVPHWASSLAAGAGLLAHPNTYMSEAPLSMSSTRPGPATIVYASPGPPNTAFFSLQTSGFNSPYPGLWMSPSQVIIYLLMCVHVHMCAGHH